MRGFERRLGIWVLCICLLCLPVATAFAAPVENCPGGCTHQAAIGATHYDTLAEALAAATDGCTVALLADVSGAAPMTIDKAITLDLGGKTLTGQHTAAERLFTVTKDLTVTNGTLTTQSGVVLFAGDCTLFVDQTAIIQGGTDAAAIAVQSQNTQAGVHISGQVSSSTAYPAIGAVSMGSNGCVITIDETAVITSADSAVEIHGAGKLAVTGGSITATENAIEMDVFDNMVMEASVTGGTFLTTNGVPFVITCGTDAAAPADFVTGGTYNRVPSAFIPDFCDVIDNGDGTYTVVSSYTLSFQSGGASGTMESVSVPCGESCLLPQCGYTPAEDMDFAGWEIDGMTYAAGDSYTPKGNVVITAQWKSHVHYGGSATCLSPAICTGCGNAYGQYGGHDLSYSGGYGASCDSTGMAAHSVCSTCGIYFVDGVETSSFSLSTPALGHQWKTEKAKEATCTETGSKEHRICSICGTIQIGGKDAQKEDLVIPALGHTLETVDATSATCTQPGVQAHTHCTTCDLLFQQEKPVDLTQLTSALSSHVLGEGWLNDETIHWKVCVDCDEAFRQDVHRDTDADGLCNDCGFAMAQEAAAPAEEASGFSWLFLTPVIAAVAIAAALVIKKRK